jgi:hypothetical protein
MKKRRRRKRHHLPDAHVSRTVEAVGTAFEMAERGLRPMPLEIENPLEAETFTGDPWETSWHFADQLLLMSIGSETLGTQPRFDILVNAYEFATTLIDIPIIAHLELEVTPVDTLPSDDLRYDNIPKGVPLWRIHSADSHEYPEDTYFMLFVSEEEETDNGEQHDR